MDACTQEAQSISVSWDSPVKPILPHCLPSSQQSPSPRCTRPPTPLLPSPSAGHRRAVATADARTHNPGHVPAPPVHAPAVNRVRWARPPSGPRQPCGPTLPPLLRICQGQVSTLPNSEFLIMPNMVSPRRSGCTGRSWVAAAAGVSWSTRSGWGGGRGVMDGRGDRGGCSVSNGRGGRGVGGRGASGSAPRNALGEVGLGGRGGAGAAPCLLAAAPRGRGSVGKPVDLCSPCLPY